MTNKKDFASRIFCIGMLRKLLGLPVIRKNMQHDKGHRLLQNEEVVERITELEQNLTTDVDVITEIEKQYEYARTNGHTNSAIKALELLSRIRGTQEEKEDMTDPVKLKEDLVKSAKIMGKDFYFDIAKEAGFLDRGNKVDNVDNKEHKE